MMPAEVAQVLAVLKAAWPDYPVPDPQAQVAAYHVALDDVPIEAAMTAARTWIRTEKWFPKAAELRAMAVDVLLPFPAAEEAWGEVIREIRNTGVYRTPSFTCLPIEQAVRALDWRSICMTEEEDVPTLRAHFYRTYDAYRRRAVKDADPEGLARGDIPRLHRGEPQYPEVPGIMEHRALEGGPAERMGGWQRAGESTDAAASQPQPTKGISHEWFE